MTEWGLAKYHAAKSSYGEHAFPIPQTNDSTVSKAVRLRVFLALISTRFPADRADAGEVIILFEWDSLRHQIFTDGRKHDTSLGPLWMGDSIGHWEGDTLVADT